MQRNNNIVAIEIRVVVTKLTHAFRAFNLVRPAYSPEVQGSSNSVPFLLSIFGEAYF